MMLSFFMEAEDPKARLYSAVHENMYRRDSKTVPATQNGKYQVRRAYT